MNKDEILARSRDENKHRMDERGEHIQIKANSISQGIGLTLCLVVGLVGLVLTGSVSIISGCSTIYTGMFAAERVAFAIKYRGVGSWILAFAMIVLFGGLAAIFVISSVKGWCIRV